MRMSKPRFVRVVCSLLVVMTATVVMSFAPGQIAAQQLEIDAPAQGAASTYAMPVVLPSEYNGDLRDLPYTSYTVPHYFHMWNEFDEPEGVQPAQLGAPVEDKPNNSPLAPMPAPSANFAGLGFDENVTGGTAGAGWPPDVNGDVGPTVYIQSVNDAYAVYNKATGARIAAFTEASLWSTASTGTVCDTDNEGDPVVLHDPLTDRWILTNFAFAFNSSGNEIAPFYQCFAVSKTSDPVTGGWYLYAVKMDTGGTGKPPANTLNDYGKFGVWTDCLYMGANGFNATSGSYVGAIFASFSKSDMYSGAPLTSSIGFISTTNNPFTMIPSNLLGSSAASLPPTGTPNYFVSQSNAALNFEVRKFTAGANCGAGGTLSAATTVSQTSYTRPGQNIVPQPNTTNKLDSLGDRLMQKVQYRKIGSAESLWVVHSTRTSASSTVRPQWAQINVSGGTITTTPVQQQIYAPDTTLYRWMGSLAVDGQGNMAVGYSISNATSPNFPSIAYSGRLIGDTVNTLPQTETIMTTGAGSQTNGPGSLSATLIHRWGDYSSMSIDPSDDCTFWYTNEYYDSQANGSISNWQTRIGSFKFPSCTSAANQTITFTSTAPAAAVIGGATYNVTATASSGLTVALTIDATASSVCSISGSTVSFIGAGNCIIDANQAGNVSSNAAPQVQQNFAVGKGSQTITYTSTAPAAAVVGGATYNVAASGGASGNVVTFTIDATASSICTISGSTVTFIGAGTCVIDANQFGNASYNAATQAQQSFAVGKGSQNITYTSTAPVAAVVGGATYNVAASGGASGNAVTFTIDATASSICSISGSTVTFIGAGTCVIDANQLGNANYNAAPQAQQSFVVGKANQTITYTSTAPVAAVVGGATYSVAATGGASGNAVTFTIDATASSVCSISGSTVTFIAAGTCVIDANQLGSANYNAASQAQQTFVVGKGSQAVTFTSTAPAAAAVGGATYNVAATGGASGNAVTFTIDATASSVCSISGSTVTFIGAGTCVIDANQLGNASYNAAPQTQQSFAVGKGSQAITFTSTAPAAATVGGATYGVTASGGASGNAVTFTIDATASSVCSISSSTVTFIGAGTCVIDANQLGNANYNAASQAQQTFVVGKGSQAVTFTSTAPAAAVVSGATYGVTASGGASGNAVTFTIDATASSTCSISGSTVTFIGAGTCVIDANQLGNGNYNAASQAQQSFVVGKGSQAVTFTSTAPAAAAVGGTTYNVTATGGASGNAVTFTIDATASSICSISGSTVTFIGIGTCVIDANQLGNSNYNAAAQVQQSFAVGIGAATQLVFTLQPANVLSGNALGTVTVTEEDSAGDVIVGDNSNIVAFTTTACGGPVTLGSVTLVNGVATLNAAPRFYTVTTGSTISASIGSLSLNAQSTTFDVLVNAGIVFADGFEGCRL